MEKRISELNKEELKLVLNANSKLQNEVLDDMLESEMFWISEQLEYIKPYLRDWSIGTNQHNYLKVADSEGFIDGLIEMDNSVPLFNDTDKAIIYRAKEKMDEFNNAEEPCEDDFLDDEEELDEAAYNGAWEDYEGIEAQLDEIVKELAEEVASKFTKRLDYCYGRDTIESYFLEFYAEERMDDTYYVDTEEGYELFEAVSYKKSYR